MNWRKIIIELLLLGLPMLLDWLRGVKAEPKKKEEVATKGD